MYYKKSQSLGTKAIKSTMKYSTANKITKITKTKGRTNKNILAGTKGRTPISRCAASIARICSSEQSHSRSTTPEAEQKPSSGRRLEDLFLTPLKSQTASTPDNETTNPTAKAANTNNTSSTVATQPTKPQFPGRASTLKSKPRDGSDDWLAQSYHALGAAPSKQGRQGLMKVLKQVRVANRKLQQAKVDLELTRAKYPNLGRVNEPMKDFFGFKIDGKQTLKQK